MIWRLVILAVGFGTAIAALAGAAIVLVAPVTLASLPLLALVTYLWVR